LRADSNPKLFYKTKKDKEKEKGQFTDITYHFANTEIRPHTTQPGCCSQNLEMSFYVPF
jgi:hypothetical protein